MDSIWLPIYLTFFVAAVVQTVVMTLQAYENRRFARSRLRKPAVPSVEFPRVALFVPCKGVDLGLEANLRPLLEQDYADYEVIFIIESADDPACAVIERLIDEYTRSARSVAAKIVIAGLAENCGQKVHNLQVATRGVSEDVDVFAFVDSDARPGRRWLATLVARLDGEVSAATTGYRWFIPQSASLANYLLAGINSGLAGLFGPGGHHLVWGGSWAISRRVFDGVALGQKWKQTLSDDLVASRGSAPAGKPVGFEPGCLVGSPLDQRFAQVFEFIRRQYTIARFYVPRWWLLAVVASTFTNVALWGSLVLAAALPAAAPRWWMPLAGGATLYALGAIKTALRHQIAQTCLPQHGDALRQLAGFDIAAWPLAALVNWAGLVASAVGDTITWRGIRYRMGRGGVVRSVERLAPASLAFTGKTAAPEEESPPSRRAAS